MHNLLDTKCQLLICALISITVYIDKSQKHVLIRQQITCHNNWHYFDRRHQNQKTCHKVLVFEELKDLSFRSRNIDLVSIAESQTTHHVQHVETPVKCTEDYTVYNFEVAPVACKVVVGIGQRVDDELHGDTKDHHDA